MALVTSTPLTIVQIGLPRGCVGFDRLDEERAWRGALR
jgi:hypothetical protein